MIIVYETIHLVCNRGQCGAGSSLEFSIEAILDIILNHIDENEDITCSRRQIDVTEIRRNIPTLTKQRKSSKEAGKGF